MIKFTKEHLYLVVDEIESLRSSVSDTEEPAYCLLTHALEDFCLIDELFEL